MIRGTNAQFKFKLPYSFSEITTVKITFWQDEYNGPSSNRPLPIVKVLQQCSSTNQPNELSITLNQEETLRFTEERRGYVQFRGMTVDGTPIASKEREFVVYPIHDDSILDEEIIPTPDYDGWVFLDGSTIV